MGAQYVPNTVVSAKKLLNPTYLVQGYLSHAQQSMYVSSSKNAFFDQKSRNPQAGKHNTVVYNLTLLLSLSAKL